MEFRQLNEKETEEFKQWARDNYSKDVKCKEIWHPVVRNEWARLKALE
jgi:hypothetical protein